MQDPAGRQDTPSAGLTAAGEAIAAGITGRWLRAVSQFGLISRAAVYLLVGYLGLRLALAVHGRAAEPVSGAGAVQEAARHSWGQASLLLLAAGFAGYALTQLVEAIFRPRHAGSRFGRWRQRALSTWGCLLYAAFCVSTISLLLAFRRPTGTARSEHLQDTEVTAALLRTVAGRLVLFLVGSLVVIAGVELGRRSVRLTFQERVHHPTAAQTVRHHRPRAGRLRLPRPRHRVRVHRRIHPRSRSVGQPTGYQRNGRDLPRVARSAYGPITLAALAIGPFSYGLYGLLEARYRDLTPGR